MFSMSCNLRVTLITNKSPNKEGCQTLLAVDSLTLYPRGNAVVP